MTQEELNEAQNVLGKIATTAVVEMLQSGSEKATVKDFSVFDGESSKNWKMTIEKVGK